MQLPDGADKTTLLLGAAHVGVHSIVVEGSPSQEELAKLVQETKASAVYIPHSYASTASAALLGEILRPQEQEDDFTKQFEDPPQRAHMYLTDFPQLETVVHTSRFPVGNMIRFRDMFSYNPIVEPLARLGPQVAKSSVALSVVNTQGKTLASLTHEDVLSEAAQVVQKVANPKGESLLFFNAAQEPRKSTAVLVGAVAAFQGLVKYITPAKEVSLEAGWEATEKEQLTHKSENTKAFFLGEAIGSRLGGKAQGEVV